jgi:hypothetical protein
LSPSDAFTTVSPSGTTVHGRVDRLDVDLGGNLATNLLTAGCE